MGSGGDLRRHRIFQAVIRDHHSQSEAEKTSVFLRVFIRCAVFIPAMAENRESSLVRAGRVRWSFVEFPTLDRIVIDCLEVSEAG